MVSWSNMLRNSEPKFRQLSSLFAKNVIPKVNTVQLRNSHNTFHIKPTSWQWQITKDLLHFYIMLGVIPLTIMTFLVNIYIGPATLEPIPEGYEPKYWEYHRHPITRFISKWMMPPPQQEYEKTIHEMVKEQKNIEVRRLHQRVDDLIRERGDYQYYYYVPVTAKYVYDGKYRTDLSKYGVSKDLGPKTGRDY